MTHSIIFPNIEPADTDRWSPHELEALAEAAGRMAYQLATQGQDITRINTKTPKFRCLLDFSELFAYIWPELSKSNYKSIIHTLLENTNIEFILPLGSMMELFNRLHQDLLSHRGKRSITDELISNPFFSALLAVYENTERSPSINQNDIESSTINNLINTVKEFREYDERLNKLTRLIETKRLKFITEMFSGNDLIPDTEILEEAYARLSARRPFREDIINYVDAHNYATAFSLTNRHHAEGYLFVLVTSSPTPYRVLDGIKWEDDPTFGSTPDLIMQTSLVRHPLHLLYVDKLRHFLNRSGLTSRDIRNDLETIFSKWSHNDANKYVNDKPIHFYGAPEGDDIKYYSAFKRFAEYYNGVFRPIGSLMKTDQTADINRRNLLGIEISGNETTLDTSLLLDTEHFQTAFRGHRKDSQDIDIRSAITLIDRVVDQTQIRISSLQKWLASTPKRTIGDLDIRSLIIEPDRYSIRRLDSDQTSSVEYTGLIKPTADEDQYAILCADKYEDYVSFWWRTDVSFTEFVKAARHFIRHAKSKVPDTIAKNHIRDNRRGFLGFHVYSSKNNKHFAIEELPDELNADTLLGLCGWPQDIRFIRLGIGIGDLCYDFEPIGAIPQRAGFVTHLILPDPISQFIHWTASAYAQRNTISSIVHYIYEH